ncbi:dihydroorotase family protein [uncultured Eudoraea sp.]|uniref:dihydroorotase n=1 Tax=uncultured Eudoraea sp. TaxID=1035614 RepID=UPI0026087CDC|nr:dihydroorotase [uncultured Eudoraea sp.]
MNILLKSATIVDKTNSKLHFKKRDILISNGIIEKIAPLINPAKKIKTLSLKNLHVSKGWFDSSVSFGEPGYEERETIANGLQVAGRSGFTDIVLNPNTFPVPDSSGAIVFLKNASRGNPTRLHPLGTLTMKCEGENLAELYDMKNAGAVGFYDFKKSVSNSNLLKIALQYAQDFKGLVYSFPIDKQIMGKGIVNEGVPSTRVGLKGIPSMAEELQIARDLFILEYTGGYLHIPTISTAKSVRLINEAKKKGLDVSCSVAIHNLLFTDDVLDNFDSNYKVLPPLRTRKDITALLKGLKDGTIDFVTSDHTPLDIEEKRLEFDYAAYGTIGLESAFGVLNRLLDTETAVNLLSKGRDRFGIGPVTLEEGSLANLSLFDPETEYVLTKESCASTSKNSMFFDQKMKGKVYGIISNNQVLV